MTQDHLPALPRPDLEGVDYEMWGQNVRADCWFEKKMRAYATAAVLAERERCARVCDDEARIRTEAASRRGAGTQSFDRCMAGARAATNCARGVRSGEVVPPAKEPT